MLTLEEIRELPLGWKKQKDVESRAEAADVIEDHIKYIVKGIKGGYGITPPVMRYLEAATIAVKTLREV